MKRKEWFFDIFCGQQVAVYAEDGKIVEIAVEDVRGGEEVGNIYKGRVENVVHGMQAAFISCGMEKNCYLSLNETSARVSTYDGAGEGGKRSALKVGDEILVQVEKAARGSKGAKVTRDLSFVGKNLIFLPCTDFLGISRKIIGEESRATLLKEADKLRAEGQGFIVRTAAETVTKRHLKTESEYLKRLYNNMLETAKTAPVGTVVYREWNLFIKVLRDSLGGGNIKMYVGDEGLYQKLLQLVRLRPDLSEKQIVRYTGKRSMLSAFGLSHQISQIAQPRVDLESGAYLVIDRTEAFTVIDVNTGKFVGEDNLEDTATKTNLLAVKEIARQVRLRNVGGIVSVDFIDMAEEEHRVAVNEALTAALQEDRSKCRVLPMNELCVTMFTRKRTSNELLAFMLKACPHCTRQGFVFSDNYIAMLIRNEINEYYANGYNAVVVELNRGVMNFILSERCFAEDLKGDWKDKRLYFVPHSSFHEEKFVLRGDNAEVLTLPDKAQLAY